MGYRHIGHHIFNSIYLLKGDDSSYFLIQEFAGGVEHLNSSLLASKTSVSLLLSF